MTQKTTLSWGGGGGGEGNVVVCLFTSECAWKGNFVIDFVHVRLVGFQIFGSLKVSTFHEPCLVAFWATDSFLFFTGDEKEDSDCAFLL